MAHKNLVGGTAYDTKGGKCLVGGTGYAVKKGRTLVGGTGYDVAFGTPIGNLAVGTSIYLRENGKLVEYFVVHQGNPDTSLYPSDCNGTWIMRKKIHSTSTINAYPYHTCSLHVWFDSTFTPQFDAATQSKMKLMRLPWWEGELTYGTGTVHSGSSGFLVRIFLPSSTEVGITYAASGQIKEGALLSYFESGNTTTANQKRVAYDESGAAKFWWTRTGASSRSYYAKGDGAGSITSGSQQGGVRPCMILDPSAAVDPNTMELLA